LATPAREPFFVSLSDVSTIDSTDSRERIELPRLPVIDPDTLLWAQAGTSAGASLVPVSRTVEDSSFVKPVNGRSGRPLIAPWMSSSFGSVLPDAHRSPDSSRRRRGSPGSHPRSPERWPHGSKPLLERLIVTRRGCEFFVGCDQRSEC
jgi:hypothetical protein